MNNIQQTLHRLKKMPLTVIVRAKQIDAAWAIIEAAINQGVQFLEITLTIPNATAIISKARKLYPQVMIGAGTVLTLAEAKKAVANDAQYLVAPIYNPTVLSWCIKNDILYVPGAMTVNEMYQAHTAGAQLIKVYPAITWSPSALALIAQPFAEFQLLVTGGITSNNIAQYFAAGVFAVGITFYPDQGGYQPALISQWIRQFLPYMQQISQQEKP